MSQVLVAYGYDWSEAPEWYKETWSKSKELLLLSVSVFNCFVFVSFLQRLMFLSNGMIPKPVSQEFFISFVVSVTFFEFSILILFKCLESFYCYLPIFYVLSKYKIVGVLIFVIF